MGTRAGPTLTAVLNEELTTHVLLWAINPQAAQSLVFHPEQQSYNSAGVTAKQWLIAQAALVNQSFAASVSVIINAWATDVISPADLLRIKKSTLDLDLDFLREEWLKAADKQLGTIKPSDYGVDSENDNRYDFTLVLFTAFTDEFPTDVSFAQVMKALAGHVECAYKKLLVVKTVETLAQSKSVPATSLWSEKCVVTKIVDLMWHCHMLHPQHYFDSCSKLLGRVGLIDHDPGYMSPNNVVGSTLDSKLNLLFAFEKPTWRVEDETMWMLTKSHEEWIELAFRDLNSEYDDCG